MIKSDIVRGHLESVILKLIIEQDRYGYEISNCISKRTDQKFQIKEATLYSIVSRLEKKDLIESYIGTKTHGKKRRYYKITALGRAYYYEKIQEWLQLKDILETLLEEKS
ncbi:PadR family transcriptional regulator [Candidatus Izimaplasma bacterium]|nr:PadR family transcriptional regulator [Candidatus Izimaplasma bacterium]